MSSISTIHSALAGDDPLLAAALVEPGKVTPGGPTEELHSAASEVLRVGVEAIREGHLLHWGGARLVQTDDEDLALLAGDRLYALGLESVAATGSEAAIIVLSRLIKASATAMAAGSKAQSEDIWTATCARISDTDS